MKHITLLIALFLFQYFNGCAEDSEFTTTQIEGIVSQADKSPLAGATVELTIGANTYLAETDENGFYTFTDIQPGLGLISLKKLENIVHEERIAVFEGKSQQYHFTINPQAEDPYLHLTNNALEVSNQKQSVALQIESNVSYTIVCDLEWVTLEDKVYQSFEPISIHIEENETLEERTAQLAITTQNGETRLATIKQQAGPVLKLSHSENLTDISAFIHKGAIFHFTQPVRFIRLESPQVSTEEITITEANQGNTLQINNFPLLLFQKIEYKLTVEDLSGNLLSVDFCQKLYQGELISKSGSDFLLNSNNTRGWLTGNSGQIISLPEMRTFKQIKNAGNYDHWAYNSHSETVNALVKTPEGNYTIDIYKGDTGELIETSILQLPEKNHLSQITYASNGLGLLTCTNRIFAITPDHQIRPFDEYKINSNSANKQQSIPYIESSFNGKGFILHGYNPVNEVTWIDANTLEMKKVVDAPNDQLCAVGKQTSTIAVGNGKEVRLIDFQQGSEKKFDSPGNFYEIVLIENEQETEYLFLLSDHCIYIIKCADGSSKKIEIPYPNLHCTSMQSIGKYIILSRYEQNENIYYNYLFPTSLFREG